MRRLQEFKRNTGIGLDEATVIVMRMRGNLSLNLTVAEAVDRYKLLRPALDLHAKRHLARFAAVQGHMPLVAINATHVRDWLAAMKGLSGQTKRHHRKNLNVFFARAVVEKWAIENPVLAVEAPKVDDREIATLSPEDCFKLLKANLDLPIVGRLAAELFGGIRCSGAQRLGWAAFKLAEKGIGFGADAQKDGRRKYRQGQPEVHAGADAWKPVKKRTGDQRKHEAFVRAGVTNTGNVLRHTFASVLLASTKNLPLVSYLMQHGSTKMTVRYEGVCSEADARLILGCSPDKVRLFDSFASYESAQRPDPSPTPG